MIKGNPDGFVSIVEEYGNKIKARVDYFIPGTNLFGVQRPIQLSVSYENDRLAGRVPTPRHRKTGPTKGVPRKEKGPDGNPIPKKGGVEKGTKRSDVNKDGRPRKKPGVPVGTKRGEFKKDGTPRKKPGPKPKAS